MFSWHLFGAYAQDLDHGWTLTFWSIDQKHVDDMGWTPFNLQTTLQAESRQRVDQGTWCARPVDTPPNADGQLFNDQEFCRKLQEDLKKNLWDVHKEPHGGRQTETCRC